MKDFTPLSLLRVSPGSQGKDVSQSAGRNVPVRRAGYKTLSCSYHVSSRDNGSLRHADDFMDETRLLEFDLLPTTTFGLRSASSFHIDIARTLQTSSNLFAESSARASGLRTLQRSCEGHGRYKTHRLLQLSPQPQACKDCTNTCGEAAKPRHDLCQLAWLLQCSRPTAVLVDSAMAKKG